jgi:hypothetical protein
MNFPDINEFIKIADEQAVGRPVTLNGTLFVQRNNGKVYNHLNIKVSFGLAMGASYIPWIVFLGHGQEVKKGIYPNFLYYKRQKLLFLVYGISEAEKPDKKWKFDILSKESVKYWFIRNYPINYSIKRENPGERKFDSSIVYKVYKVNGEIPSHIIQEIQNDTDELINYYHNYMQGKDLPNVSIPKEEQMSTPHFQDDSFIEKIIRLLEYKKNIILQGAPGTGKTYTAKNVAEQLIFNEVSSDKEEQAKCLENSSQYKLVQFHPSYTYEDFVRGIVVKTENGQLKYVTQNKALGEFAKKALENYKYIVNDNLKVVLEN